MNSPARIDLTSLQQSAEQATLFLRSVGNRDRLLLLCQLVDGERSVGELEAATGVRQPTLSQQLAVLREEGLVATRREGKYIHYSLASSEVVQLLQLLQSLFCSPTPATASRRKGVGP
jgi:DNA-binding transcriptional ArsR family regulator